MTREERQNRKLAMEMLEYLGSNNTSGILDMLADNCEFHVGSTRTRGIVPWHGVHVGHNQIGEYLKRRIQYLHRDNCGYEAPQRGKEEQSERGDDGTGGTAEKFIVDGDTVVAIGRLTDSFNDPRGPMYTSDFVLVFRIKGGKITKFQYFHDTDAVVHAWRTRYPGANLARES